jgi:dihydropteroate synthase
VLDPISRRRELHADLAGIEVGDGFPVRIVGAINVSGESFYAGSVARNRGALQRLAVHMVEEGADLLDLGAMSTAPYVKGAIGAADERRRMVAAVRAVRQVVTVPLSADTQRSTVAAAALDAGAAVINDVSGLSYDAGMAPVARQAAGVILMAAEQKASAAPPVPMVLSLLRGCLRRAKAAGVDPRRIVLDPGVGFFRRAAVPWYEFDCLVLSRLTRLRQLHRPLLVGVSRKSFIGKLSGRSDPAERLPGSLAAAAIAVYNGAALIRTHDVGATRDAVRIAAALRSASDR